VSLLDGTRPVRAGEELDPPRLREYLAATLGTTGEPEVEQFPGGHSNLTYLVHVDGRELVLRRPPFG
jgi:aminoglycoside phosphotransferase (APT) family kinase protein